MRSTPTHSTSSARPAHLRPARVGAVGRVRPPAERTMAPEPKRCRAAHHGPAHQQQHQQQQQQQQQQQFGEVEASLESIGFRVGSHSLLLLCVALVWAGDAAEVLVLPFLAVASACEFGLTPSFQALLGAAVFGGMLAGAAGWGWLGDRRGRLAAVTASSAVVVVAGLASAAAPTPALLMLSRALVGLGLAGSPQAFILLTELLPQRRRAVISTAIELAWTAGMVAEAACAWGVLNSHGWRALLVLSALPLGLVLVLSRWLPESPRFLVSQGDAAGASAVLQRMAAANGKAAPATPALSAAAAAASGLQLVSAPANAVLNPAGCKEAGDAAPLLDQLNELQQRSGHSASTQQEQQQDAAPPSCGGWLQLPRAPPALSSLFSARHASTTGLLLLSWAALGFSYNALVQLAAGGTDGSTGHDCVGGALQVPGSEFAAVLVTAVAEVLAIAWAIFSAHVWGSRRAQVASLLLCSACLLPPLALASFVGAADGLGGAITGFSMFGSRLFVAAAYALLWVHTPALFPTRARGLGMGLANASARIGGLLSPFAAINLTLATSPAVTQVLLAAACLAASVAVLMTPQGLGEEMEEDAGRG